MRDPRRRLDDLLLSRAIAGLDPAAATELDRLLAENPGVDADGYELAAAAVWLAALDFSEPLPQLLRDEIEQRAEKLLGPRAG
jgi:hypothetical protein